MEFPFFSKMSFKRYFGDTVEVVLRRFRNYTRPIENFVGLRGLNEIKSEFFMYCRNFKRNYKKCKSFHSIIFELLSPSTVVSRRLERVDEEAFNAK